MGAGGDGLARFLEHQVHRLGVGPRNDNGDAGVAIGANGAEQIGGLEAMVAHGSRSGAARRPALGQRSFLADSRFVLEPDFEGTGFGVVLPDGGEDGGEVFLNVSWASGSVLGWIGRGER